MPLFNQIENNDFLLGLWKIHEDDSFFESKFSAPEITNQSRRMQWFATRHLVNELSGKPCEVLKDPLGKPYLADDSFKLSLSHTAVFAGAMLSKAHEVGVDLEMLTPKVERIAHKFLKQHELETIHADEKIEKLILYWSAKEALYKLHGRKVIEFKTQLLIDPFELNLKGVLNAAVKADDVNWENLKVHYEFFEDHVLTYVLSAD